MKKAFITLTALLLLFVFGCANETSTTTYDNSVQSYILSFNSNFPAQLESTNTYIYAYSVGNGKDDAFPNAMIQDAGNNLTLPGTIYYYDLALRSTFETVTSFHFSHWNTEPDDKGTSYTAGQVITLTEDMTLYAIYLEDTGTDTGDNSGDSDDNDTTNILDIYTTKQFSMKVGQSVTLKSSWGTECYYTITSNDNNAVSISGTTLTANAIGTAVVQMTSTTSSTSAAYCTISVTSEGFEGKVIENKMLGTWVYTGSSSNGTIVLNSDMTGHITAYLNSSKVHDNNFTWSAYEGKSNSTTYQFLTIEGTGVDSLDGDHQITNVYSTRFTLKGYLAFGMPSETTWYKQ